MPLRRPRPTPSPTQLCLLSALNPTLSTRAHILTWRRHARLIQLRANTLLIFRTRPNVDLSNVERVVTLTWRYHPYAVGRNVVRLHDTTPKSSSSSSSSSSITTEQQQLAIYFHHPRHATAFRAALLCVTQRPRLPKYVLVATIHDDDDNNSNNNNRNSLLYHHKQTDNTDSRSVTTTTTTSTNGIMIHAARRVTKHFDSLSPLVAVPLVNSSKCTTLDDNDTESDHNDMQNDKQCLRDDEQDEEEDDEQITKKHLIRRRQTIDGTPLKAIKTTKSLSPMHYNSTLNAEPRIQSIEDPSSSSSHGQQHLSQTQQQPYYEVRTISKSYLDLSSYSLSSQSSYSSSSSTINKSLNTKNSWGDRPSTSMMSDSLRSLITERVSWHRLQSTRSPFILRLVNALETCRHVHLISEWSAYGTLQRVLSQCPSNRLPEQLARPLFAQLVAAVHDVHKAGFLHRGINTSAIRITGNGHIKLGNFANCTPTLVAPEEFEWGAGWNNSYHHQVSSSPRRRRKSMDSMSNTSGGGGRFPFMSSTNSPVSVMHSSNHDRYYDGLNAPPPLPHHLGLDIVDFGYGGAVDIWGLGVTLYQMLVGHAPFQEEKDTQNRYSSTSLRQQDEQSTFLLSQQHQYHPYGNFNNNQYHHQTTSLHNRAHVTVSVPDGLLSPIAVDLLNAMLHFDDSRRVDVYGIMEHPWLTGIDWGALRDSTSYPNSVLVHGLDSLGVRPRHAINNPKGDGGSGHDPKLALAAGGGMISTKKKNIDDDYDYDDEEEDDDGSVRDLLNRELWAACTTGDTLTSRTHRPNSSSQCLIGFDYVA